MITKYPKGKCRIYNIKSLGDSSVLHCASIQRRILRVISARIHKQNGVFFFLYGLARAKEINCRFLVKKRGDLYFLLHNFGVKLFSLS